MTPDQQAAASRQAIVDTLRLMSARGLNTGTAGNASLRTRNGMLITPTGVAADTLHRDDIVHLTLDGTGDPGQLKPSSEWLMHAAVYRQKTDAGAIVHCHSPYATMIACTRRPIPAMHYMVAAAGADHIPLADYARFGSEALSRNTVRALTRTRACLLANHGQIATGATLADALSLAELVEEQAKIYWGTLAVGGPVLLDESQMAEVKAAFASYGQQNPGD